MPENVTFHWSYIDNFNLCFFCGLKMIEFYEQGGEHKRMLPVVSARWQGFCGFPKAQALSCAICRSYWLIVSGWLRKQFRSSITRGDTTTSLFQWHASLLWNPRFSLWVVEFSFSDKMLCLIAMVPWTRFRMLSLLPFRRRHPFKLTHTHIKPHSLLKWNNEIKHNGLVYR